jgi:hypothetical protein
VNLGHVPGAASTVAPIAVPPVPCLIAPCLITPAGVGTAPSAVLDDVPRAVDIAAAEAVRRSCR